MFMRKEEIGLIAQLLVGMRDAAEKLEEAYKKKDFELFNSAKKEILQFQTEIGRLIW